MAAMNDMCVIIEHDKKKKQVRELNVSETQRNWKFLLALINEGIKETEKEVQEREINDLLDGDLYKKSKDINIVYLRHMKEAKKYLSLNIVFINNILNNKFHLLNNNLDFIKKYRDSMADIMFDDKDDVSDRYFKNILESLDRQFKDLQLVVKSMNKKKIYMRR